MVLLLYFPLPMLLQVLCPPPPPPINPFSQIHPSCLLSHLQCHFFLLLLPFAYKPPLIPLRLYYSQLGSVSSLEELASTVFQVYLFDLADLSTVYTHRSKLCKLILKAIPK